MRRYGRQRRRSSAAGSHCHRWSGLPATIPESQANFAVGGPGANAYMGSVAGIGDVDGDGYADIAIGSWNASSHGSVIVYRGSQASSAAPCSDVNEPIP